MAALFEEITINGMTMHNRMVRSATWEGMCGQDGKPTEKLINLYRELAQGGVGLIVTGFTFVQPEGKQLIGKMGIHTDDFAGHFQKLTAAVHEAGAKIALQMNHGGRQCNPAAVDGLLLAPSSIPLNRDAPRPIEMSERQIQATIRAFADAAGRVQEAGFDAVQIHGAHGFLINAFNSPTSNWRRDAWGGSLPRRVRFLEEVTAAVRDVVGDDYPVFIKLGTTDFVRDGLTEKDGVEIISHLADMGLDAVEISGGIGSGNTRTGIRSPDQDRLQHTLLPYRIGELFEALAIEIPARLVGIRSDRLDLNPGDDAGVSGTLDFRSNSRGRFRFLTGTRDQSVKTLSEFLS